MAYIYHLCLEKNILPTQADILLQVGTVFRHKDIGLFVVDHYRNKEGEREKKFSQIVYVECQQQINTGAKPKEQTNG